MISKTVKAATPGFAAFVAKASGLLANPAVCAVLNKYSIGEDFLNENRAPFSLPNYPLPTLLSSGANVFLQ